MGTLTGRPVDLAAGLSLWKGAGGGGGNHLDSITPANSNLSIHQNA